MADSDQHGDLPHFDESSSFASVCVVGFYDGVMPLVKCGVCKAWVMDGDRSAHARFHAPEL